MPVLLEGTRAKTFLRVFSSFWPIAFLFSLLVLIVSSPVLREMIVRSMGEAFLQVSVFVAATLALVQLVETFFATDTGQFLKKFHRSQPFFTALLGSIPGCGGAIVVVTQYTRGCITFGSLVAALIATMGDAAFLLLAREFFSGVIVILTGIFVGAFFGMLVDITHGADFMIPKENAESRVKSTVWPTEGNEQGADSIFWSFLDSVWFVVVAIGVLLGVLSHLQFEFEGEGIFSESFVRWFALWGAGLCLFVWATQVFRQKQGTTECELDSPFRRVIFDTSFVTGWVLLGLLFYELSTYALGVRIDDLFNSWKILLPFFAIIVGFLPGCGPQIVVTSLYLNGALPFSAQLGNAISNDGDALFPAIALAPYAAILATLYSAIPAFILAYGYYFFFE